MILLKQAFSKAHTKYFKSEYRKASKKKSGPMYVVIQRGEYRRIPQSRTSMKPSEKSRNASSPKSVVEKKIHAENSKSVTFFQLRDAQKLYEA